jgi:hypothetical protein
MQVSLDGITDQQFMDLRLKEDGLKKATEAVLEGQPAGQPIHGQVVKLLPLMNINFIESNPIPVKAVLGMMGLIEENYRLPMVPLSPSLRAPLRKLATTSKSELARVMALYSLQGLSALQPSQVASAFGFKDPSARQHALRGPSKEAVMAVDVKKLFNEDLKGAVTRNPADAWPVRRAGAGLQHSHGAAAKQWFVASSQQSGETRVGCP